MFLLFPSMSLVFSMAPPPSDASLSSSNNRLLKPHNEIYHNPDSNLSENISGGIQEFRLFDRVESLQKEKQISVDPFSLRELSPVVVTPKVSGLMELPPALMLGKPKFLSCSLPNSATSSPRFSSSFMVRKYKNEFQRQPSTLQHESSNEEEQPNTEVQHKQVTLPLEFYLRRSKSCGEGRSFAPSDDFDLWVDKPEFNDQVEKTNHFNSSNAGQITSKVNHHNHHKKSSDNHKYSRDIELSSNDGFKCGALCLFIPGFGKAKTVRPSRKQEVEIANVISRTVSLEKFECGSWASTVIGEGDSANSYFDLPMELIRGGANDAHSPVTTAFLFDKDLKGVLKNGASRKSHDSGRHVRFSTASPTSHPASPTCITPRLRKAREDFNAFLEAQNA